MGTHHLGQSERHDAKDKYFGGREADAILGDQEEEQSQFWIDWRLSDLEYILSPTFIIREFLIILLL